MGTGRSWSVDLGRVAGIRIRVHASFLLLVALIVLAVGVRSPTAFLDELGWIAVIFACVVVHELAHSLLARRLGVVVRDILLLPIGGVSEMESMPDDPLQELAIAAAGPGASLVLAGASLALGAGLGSPLWPPTLTTGEYLVRLGWLNALLAGFNLVPALPLDGGRVLRAALAIRMGRQRATRVACALGRGLGVLMALAGVFYNVWLLFIGAFVYLGAASEGRHERLESALRQIPVQSAMIWSPWVVDRGRLLDPVLVRDACLTQGVVPVTAGGALVGVIGPEQLQAVAAGSTAGEAADPLAPAVEATGTLDGVLDVLRSSRQPAVVVLGPGRTVAGVVRASDLVRYVAGRGPLRRAPARSGRAA